MRQHWLRMLYLSALALPLCLAGCGGSSGGGGTVADDPAASPGADRTAVAERLAGVLNIGYNTINPDDLAELLMDQDTGNDPYLIDTRDASDFGKGHLPGAVNIPLKGFAAAYKADRTLVPADRNVVVVSYYGGDGNMASLLINAVRIADPADAASYPWSKGLFMGMMSWNFDEHLSAGHRFDDDLYNAVYNPTGQRVDRPVVSPRSEGGAYELATLADAGGTVEAQILTLADAYFQKAADQLDLQFTPVDLARLLDDTDPSNNPQIVSVRGTGDYDKGHIPGALNLPWKSSADLDLLAAMDPSKPTVVYCYTGHTGSIATMVLGLLGYDTVNLLYGINGWNCATEIASGQLLNFDQNKGWELPVTVDADGDGADDLASLAALPRPTGCVDCHTNQAALLYELAQNPPETGPVAESIGEG